MESGIKPKINPKIDPGLRHILRKIKKPDDHPFSPDPYQQEAVTAITAGDCLVTAPTGAGKTWIAIKAMEARLKNGHRAWYACPLKALGNQKYLEFQRCFGESRVGILTGDHKENPDAPIIVGTTEVLRNQLYDAMHSGYSLHTDLVVLDEAHYLGDPDRGVVWEEIMIYLPSRIPLLLLSATIGNAQEIRAWLQSVRKRPCKLISETERPVPLFPLFYRYDLGLIPFLKGTGKRGKIDSRILRKTNKMNRNYRGISIIPPIMETLKKARLLPVIFFLKSRSDCDRAVQICRHFKPRGLGDFGRRKQRIEAILANHPRLKRQRQLKPLLHQGIGSHHAGQLPVWKMTLEILMATGCLDAIFATSTVAAGVNFPARTIVILNSDRFNGREFLPLSATEFHQMAGRAGRRGMDEIGFVMMAAGRHMDPHWTAGLLSAPPTDVNSRIQVNFSMTLNLLMSHTPDQATDLLRKSFGAWQRAKDGASEWEQSFMAHLHFLKKTGYVRSDNRLSEDGVWCARLRMDQPLLIAEGLQTGAFPVEKPALTAAMAASFLDEKAEDDQVPDKYLDSSLMDAFLKMVTKLRPFVDTLREEGFFVRSLYLRPAYCVFLWASGQSWEKICRVGRMAEGDLARLILRTADCLRHIKGLDDIFPDAAHAAHEAEKMILKQPVIDGTMDGDTLLFDIDPLAREDF